MPDPTIPTPIALNSNLRAVLPIGIPLGWSLDSHERRFTVRRGGSFCQLDEEGYQFWTRAWAGPDPAFLINQLAMKWQCDPEKTASDLHSFCDGNLLVRLCGDWRDDWLRLASFRVIPRVAIAGGDQSKGYQMLLAGGELELRLNNEYYNVWAFWDGNTTIERSVAAAAQASNLPRRLLQERAHALVVASVRVSAIFLDLTTK